MKPTAIKIGRVYSVMFGKGKTSLVQVKDFDPKNGSWICETDSGKNVSIKDAKRFVKEIGAKSDPNPASQSKTKSAKSAKPKKSEPTALPASDTDMEQLKKELATATKKFNAAKNAFAFNLCSQHDLDVAEQELADLRAEAKVSGLSFGKGGRANGEMGGKEAALRILQEEGRPMRAKELCELAHERGYCNLTGATPWATMAAAITTEIKARGEDSRFKRVDAGLFVANE